MVRQVEVEKPRRTNMVNSSINTAPKKGGAGGNFTWGATAEAAYYYESFGPELNLAGVIVAPTSESIEWKGSNAPFDMNLENLQLFPCLSTTIKSKEADQATTMASETPAPIEQPADWVVVTPPSEDSSSPPSCTDGFALVNAPHSTKRSSKKIDVNQIAPEGALGERALTIDWSQEGMPQEVTKKIIKASLSSSHRGLYGNGAARSLSVDALRAQHTSSKHRQDSRSKSRHNATPRSQSKPRVIKQPTGRR